MAAPRDDIKTEKIAQLFADGMKAVDIAAMHNVTKQSIYYHLRKYKAWEAAQVRVSPEEEARINKSVQEAVDSEILPE